jgi:hypothetical protein
MPAIALRWLQGAEIDSRRGLAWSAGHRRHALSVKAALLWVGNWGAPSCCGGWRF